MTSLSIALSVFCMPLAWSIAVWGARRTSPISDGAEKQALGLMLAPTILGLAVWAAASAFPDISPIPVPPVFEEVLSEALPPPAAPIAYAPQWSVDTALSALMCVYLIVALFKAIRLAYAQFRLWHIARNARAKADIRLSHADIPPLALSWAVVLPVRLLKVLNMEQARLVLAH